MEIARKCVNYFHGQPKMVDKLKELQKAAKLPELQIVKENSTRWNSLLAMLERFLKLKHVLPLLLVNTDLLPSDFEWNKLQKFCNVLKPLEELTLKVEAETADVSVGIQALEILKHLAAQEPALNSPIKCILKKHIDGNPIVNAILYKHGEFNDSLKAMYRLNATVQAPSSDHEYNPFAPKTFSPFVAAKVVEQFDVKVMSTNFRPTSADTDRVYSLARISKNFLQNRLSTANHNRNVFLKKNISFLVQSLRFILHSI